MGVAEPEWFPAGVTPSRFPWEGEEIEDMTAAEEVQLYQMTWMDSQTLSTRELHRAATRIGGWGCGPFCIFHSTSHACFILPPTELPSVHP